MWVTPNRMYIFFRVPPTALDAQGVAQQQLLFSGPYLLFAPCVPSQSPVRQPAPCMLFAPPVPGESPMPSRGPVRQAAPCMLLAAPVPSQSPVHTQMCSGASLVKSIEEMNDDDIHALLKTMQSKFGVPPWMRVETETTDPDQLKKYRKMMAFALLIAPRRNELEKLDQIDDLIRCIRAMERQNEIPDSKSIEITDSNEIKDLRLYAARLIPDPFTEDFETMTRGRLVASATRMCRDLCITVEKYPDFERMNRYEIMKYAEGLVAKYPRAENGRYLQFPKTEEIRAMAHAVNLPEATLSDILEMHSRTEIERTALREKIRPLRNAYHFLPFISRTTSRSRVYLWRDYEDKAYTIKLETCTDDWHPAKGTLFLTICTPKNGDYSARFSLFTQGDAARESRRNVTQFMQVEFGHTDHVGMPFFFLEVYDPVDESSADKSESTHGKLYRIPCPQTEDLKDNQRNRLEEFLSKFGTKIGQAVHKESRRQRQIGTRIYEFVDREGVTLQQYRARDPTDRMTKCEAALALGKAFAGNDDVVENILSKAFARSSLT